MVKQYQDIKAQYKDAILMFRLGDFYEMFNEDAELASRELELTLTGRGQNENRMPMCGIPHHAAENYIAKLIEKGYRVAICDQVENPKEAIGIVKREVVRVITPGTVLESSMLASRSSNYLMAISFEKGKFGLAWIEASTGEFKISEIETQQKLIEEINRINPSELLVSDLLLSDEKLSMALKNLPIKSRSPFKDNYDKESAETRLKEHFKLASLSAFGIEEYSVGLSAAVAILDYLQKTQKTTLGYINKIQGFNTNEFMVIDSQTRKNLELDSTIRDKSLRGSLLWVLDFTKTNMGSRLLKSWILTPLIQKELIVERLDAVEELFGNAILRVELGDVLKEVYDIERLSGRIGALQANAKDLVALRDSLQKLPKLIDLLKASKSFLLSTIQSLLSNLQNGSLSEVSSIVTQAIKDDPPHYLTEGGLINDGFSPELDEIRKATRGGKTWIAELENSERIRTGIKSLKVGFTKVFGYYIEISNSNLNSVPADYIRKQTLVNGERFITPDLKEKEALILNADERMKDLELQIFKEVREKVAAHTKDLQTVAEKLAVLDVILSLSEAAVQHNYVRPSFPEPANKFLPAGRHGAVPIMLKDCRHPVVEKTIGEHNFTPNDILMDDESRFYMITGPNMAGKSTLMRQVALISVMAQLGSFVPAKKAELSIVDRIFTRIGAMDDIFSGQSTFMLEMTETANILNNATDKSLIILDEIGRGTATFDGMSIAAAVAEYIHDKIKAKTMFATHYHEITQLAENHPGMKNFNILIKEEGEEIKFLHKIKEGSADKSYGIAVARLAGLPKEVISRAKEVYETLEMVESDLGRTEKNLPKIKKFKSLHQDQVGLF